jgi:GTP-binding protein
MRITTAKYLQSCGSVEQCPAADKPEFAFIGRSNVGKSSLINFLTDNNKLALTSSKPGKTRAINHFLINEEWYLVDLPGYGYAQTSKEQRGKWLGMIRHYLVKRQNLLTTFVLVDGSISPQKKDLDFINWLGESGIPFCIVFTKTDKEKEEEIGLNIGNFNKLLKESWDELPKEILTSVQNKLGRDAILSYIADCISEAGPLFKTALK